MIVQGISVEWTLYMMMLLELKDVVCGILQCIWFWKRNYECYDLKLDRSICPHICYDLSCGGKCMILINGVLNRFSSYVNCQGV